MHDVSDVASYSQIHNYLRSSSVYIRILVYFDKKVMVHRLKEWMYDQDE